MLCNITYKNILEKKPIFLLDNKNKNGVYKLTNTITKCCVYESMKNNVYTNNYKFYMYISHKSITI